MLTTKLPGCYRIQKNQNSMLYLVSVYAHMIRVECSCHKFREGTRAMYDLQHKWKSLLFLNPPPPPTYTHTHTTPHTHACTPTYTPTLQVGNYTDDQIEQLVPLTQLQLDPSVAELFHMVFRRDHTQRPTALQLLNHPQILDGERWC